MNQLEELRKTPIADVDMSTIEDGVYQGEALFGNYTYKVEVTVENYQMTDIKDFVPRESAYVTYATGEFSKMIKHQTPNVDAVSGATTTSKAFMKAVENALKQ